MDKIWIIGHKDISKNLKGVKEKIDLLKTIIPIKLI